MKKKLIASGIAFVMVVLTGPLMPTSASAADLQGGYTIPEGHVNVTKGDLQFILDQIKISEAHAARTDVLTPSTTAPFGYSLDACMTAADIASANALTGANVLSRPYTFNPNFPFGLRQVDARCNNITTPANAGWGAADEIFPRLIPRAPVSATSYPVVAPNGITDASPRVVSNLIVDQTAANKAAIAAATALGPITTEVSVNATTQSRTTVVKVGNTVPGGGPAYNGLFTIFGQFFDHGLDLLPKEGNGKVTVPLKPSDPLYVPGGRANFMQLTRAQNTSGESINLTTPYTDQNQTYTSHPSHQVLLREYKFVNNRPVATGNLLDGTDSPSVISSDGTRSSNHANPTWRDVKDQAKRLLGITLTDADVSSVPTIMTDQYGNFIPGPNGYALLVLASGTAVVEGDPAANIGPSIGANAGNIRPTGHAFLDDIAHNAVPTFANLALAPDTDVVANSVISRLTPAGSYDNELLEAHYITGDGRGNENVGLTAVHHVFHAEHNTLVTDIKGLLGNLQNSDRDFVSQWWDGTNFNGNRLFLAARLINEAAYQHLVFDEFARRFQPALAPFGAYNPNENAAISAEFAHSVYRFGHSMLTETIGRSSSVGVSTPANANNIGLIQGFLNPLMFRSTSTDFTNPGAAISADQGAGNLAQGLVTQRDAEIDEFVTESLRNNLLGLPLDLSTLNITRARDTGVSTLNTVRALLFSQTGQPNLVPYKSWKEFQLAMRTPASLVNFVAAYGTHPSIPRAQTITGISATSDGTKITYVSPMTLPEATFSVGQFVEATGYVLPTGGVGAALNIVGQISSRVDTPTSTTFTVPSTATATATAQLGSVEYSPSTAEMRNAADKIVNAQAGSPVDSFQFLTGQPAPVSCLNDDGSACGNWALMPTGLNSVDLWMGGLAEMPAIQPGASGLLGSTFDYVFTEQMRMLQDGDRFYYLARLAGTNLLGEIENQGFASIIQRNSTARALTNTVFSMPDCTIDIAQTLGHFNTPSGAIEPAFAQAGCPELTQMPDGTIRFDGVLQNVVMAGTSGNDKIRGGLADDTIWGAAGNDELNGGDGNDNISGEAGNDVIIDSAGNDVIRGGTGDDIINGGPGLDIIQGGIGNDFIFGGDATGTKTAEGQDGNDFISGSEGSDGAAGGSGNDWLQGNSGDDILGGDNGANEDLFVPTDGGDDVLIGGAGNDRVEGDAGNDIMVGGNGFDGFAGGPGYDWVIYNGAVDPVLVDLENIAAGVVPLDDFLEVEGVSGSAGNDFIFGDSLNASQLNNSFSNITNFNAILNGVAGANNILARSTGNILLGGSGNDTFVPRGGNDLIHGDAYIRVCVLVSGVVGNTACGTGMGFESINEVSSLMTTRNKTPGDITIVRELVVGAKGNDTVVLPGRRGDYNISSTSVTNGNFRTSTSIGANEVVTVTGGGQTLTLIGIENIQFLGTNLLPILPGTTFTVVQNENITITQNALASLAIDVTALQSGVYGDTSYFVTLDAFGGTGTYSWSVSSGALPMGLTLDSATGVISGPLTAVTATSPAPLVTLQVRDGQSTQTVQLPLVVSQKPLTVIVSNRRVVTGVESIPAYIPVGLTGTDAITAVTYTYTGINGTTYGPSSTVPTAAGTYSVAPNAISLAAGASIMNYAVSRTAGQLLIGDAILSNRINPTINWTTPAVVSTGTFLSETQLNATIAGGIPGEITYSPAIGTLIRATTVVRATFVPTDTATYNMAAGSVVVTVGTPVVNPPVVNPPVVNPPTGGGGSFVGGGIVQVKPVLEWSVPASITTDQKLDSTILKAKVTTPSALVGTFKYDVAEGSTLPVGTKKITATFTPTDTLMFETVSISVDLKVVQAVIAADMVVSNLNTVYDGGAKPVVIQTTPSGLAYTVTYNGSTVAPANAGTYEVVATMTDPAYSGKITRTLVIAKAAPRLTWAVSGMMSSTSTVPASALNAQATVPGVFAYSVQAGATLPVGMQEVVATFTPNDSTNYAVATARMSMEVVPGLKDMAMSFASNNSKLSASTLRTLDSAMKIPSSVIVVKSYVSPTKNKTADLKLSLTRGNLVRAQILARNPGAKVTVQAKGSTKAPQCVAQANRCVVLSVNN